MPEAEIETVLRGARLEAIIPQTLVSLAAIRARLAATRELDHSVSREELDPDVLGVAAPLRDDTGAVVAAISVAAVSARVPEDRLAQVAAAVRSAAEEISRGLVLRG